MLRERIIFLDPIIRLERIIFLEDTRFDFIIRFERIGAIMPECPEERDMPEPPMEPPIWPDWARAGAESKATAAANISAFFIGYSS